MKVLVVGGGGREHALAWKLHQSESVTSVSVAPGNAGIRDFATAVPIPVDNIAQLKQFAVDKAIDLTVVGPDNALANGIVDEFQQASTALPVIEAALSRYSAQRRRGFAKKKSDGANT